MLSVKEMKVYEFPAKSGLAATSPPATPDGSRLHIGPIGFTCPHCSTSSELHFNNMIFKSVEFHCGHCGNFYRLANPGFAIPPKKPK
jgi:hypothetical protein